MSEKLNRLSKEDVIDLIQEFREGKKEKIDFFIQKYQPLVMSIAKKYTDYLQNSELQDLVQEGNIALLKAINIYDGKHAFSTIAAVCVNRAIINYISRHDRLITRPSETVERKINEYNRIKSECEKNNLTIPSDEELCKMLNVTIKHLQTVKEESKTHIISLNGTPKDKKNTEMEEIIEDTSFNFDTIVDNMDTRNLLLVLKASLSPKEYYVLYYKSIVPKNRNFSKLSRYFYMRESSLRKVYNRALKKAKVFLDTENTSYVEVLKQLKQQNGSLDKLNPFPIEPEDILKYEFIKDHLTEQEKKLFYLRFVEKHNYTNKKYLLQLKITKEEWYKLVKSLKIKIKKYFQNQDKWHFFKRSRLESYKINIFDNALFSPIDYQKLEETYQSISDIEEFDKLSWREQRLLRQYFAIPVIHGTIKELEMQINLRMLDYEYKDTTTPLNLLYTYFLDNKSLFSEEQQMFMQAYIFKKIDKKAFLKKYPNSYYAHEPKKSWINLEKKFYCVPNLMNKSLQKRHYLEVRDKLPKEKQEALDNFYEKNSDSKRIYNTKIFAINVLLNREKASISKEIYIPYLKDLMEEIDDLHKLLLQVYFIDNFSYDEIMEKIKDANWLKMKLKSLNLSISTEEVLKRMKSKKTISIMILNDVKKMDYYRFRMKQKINKEAFENILSYFDDMEREILRSKYIKKETTTNISKKYQQSIVKINLVIHKFEELYQIFLTKDVILTEEDLKEEINLHPSERLLNEEQIKILSFSFGILSSYNLKPEKLKVNEIEERFGIQDVKTKLEHILKQLKLKKIGELKKENCYIKREELEKILEDPHLPLHEQEKILIYHLFGLKGYPYMDIYDLSRKENQTTTEISAKYEMAIIKIYKYLAHEIPGKLSYELDVKPYLKYFSKSNQYIMVEKYKNNKTTIQIATECGLTENIIKDKIIKIEYELYGLRKNEYVEKFDYDSVEEAVKDPQFPYYKDKKLMKEVFDLFFGQNMMQQFTLQEIIEKLNLSCNQKVLETNLYEFMISVCKWNAKIRKNNTFSKEEARKFYETQKEKLNETELNAFKNYFDKLLKRKCKFRMPDDITCILLKYQNPRYIDLSASTRDEIFNFLKSPESKKLSSKMREELMAYFQINPREFLNGKEKQKVFRILNDLEKKKQEDITKLHRKMN